jgi:uncharacterized protein (TIGR02118 family)
MSEDSVVLINLLKVDPEKQDALIALLKHNIDAVVSTLDGWKGSRLIAAPDGASVVIYSEWETPAAVEAMRGDARMQVCFRKILELASVDSMQGDLALSRRRRSATARMVVIYRTPKNIEAFDRHYFETHVPLAKKIPGLRRYELSDGPVVTPLGNPDVYRIGTVHFDDLAAIKHAFASPEGQAAGADRQIYAPADSGIQMFLFDNKEV